MRRFRAILLVLSLSLFLVAGTTKRRTRRRKGIASSSSPPAEQVTASVMYKEIHDKDHPPTYFVPKYVDIPTKEEENEMFPVKPKMVESGHFERILCEAYRNCTGELSDLLLPKNENAKPRGVSEGSIEKHKTNDIRERMREALLMRWNTVSQNVLSDVEKQTRVCHALGTLQPIADLVASQGNEQDVDDATRLFKIVCSRVKGAFPVKAQKLDCHVLHKKVAAKSLFHVGDCCDCQAVAAELDEMRNILESQHATLRRAFENGKPKEKPSTKVEPVIVDSLNSTEARLVGGESGKTANSVSFRPRDFKRENGQLYYRDEEED